MKSSTGAHAAPLLVVFQMPPPTLPANHVLVVVGWIAMARVRPPMLPGPSQVHEPGPMPAADGEIVGPADCDACSRIASACALAMNKPFSAMLPYSSRHCACRNFSASSGESVPTSGPPARRSRSSSVAACGRVCGPREILPAPLAAAIKAATSASGSDSLRERCVYIGSSPDGLA